MVNPAGYNDATKIMLKFDAINPQVIAEAEAGDRLKGNARENYVNDLKGSIEAYKTDNLNTWNLEKVVLKLNKGTIATIRGEGQEAAEAVTTGIHNLIDAKKEYNRDHYIKAPIKKIWERFSHGIRGAGFKTTLQLAEKAERKLMGQSSPKEIRKQLKKDVDIDQFSQLTPNEIKKLVNDLPIWDDGLISHGKEFFISLLNPLNEVQRVAFFKGVLESPKSFEKIEQICNIFVPKFKYSNKDINKKKLIESGLDKDIIKVFPRAELLRKIIKDGKNEKLTQHKYLLKAYAEIAIYHALEHNSYPFLRGLPFEVQKCIKNIDISECTIITQADLDKLDANWTR